MRILGSVVAPSTALVAFCDSKIMGCGSIRSQLIRDELVWDKAIFLQKLAHEFKRRPLVPPALDQHIEDLAFGVDSAPEVDHAAIDLEIDFVHMPGRVGLRSAFAQVRRDLGSKMIHPAPDGLLGFHDPTLGQQILDVAKAQGQPAIKPDRVLDDFGRKAIAAIADFDHREWYGYRSVTANPPPTKRPRQTLLPDSQSDRRAALEDDAVKRHLFIPIMRGMHKHATLRK